MYNLLNGFLLYEVTIYDLYLAVIFENEKRMYTTILYNIPGNIRQRSKVLLSK